MKEKYIIPKIEMIIMEAADVITSSTELDWDEDLGIKSADELGI